jgi:hypothetical protein
VDGQRRHARPPRAVTVPPIIGAFMLLLPGAGGGSLGDPRRLGRDRLGPPSHRAPRSPRRPAPARAESPGPGSSCCRWRSEPIPPWSSCSRTTCASTATCARTWNAGRPCGGGTGATSSGRSTMAASRARRSGRRLRGRRRSWLRRTGAAGRARNARLRARALVGGDRGRRHPAVEPGRAGDPAALSPPVAGPARRRDERLRERVPSGRGLRPHLARARARGGHQARSHHAAAELRRADRRAVSPSRRVGRRDRNGGERSARLRGCLADLSAAAAAGLSPSRPALARPARRALCGPRSSGPWASRASRLVAPAMRGDRAPSWGRAFATCSTWIPGRSLSRIRLHSSTAPPTTSGARSSGPIDHRGHRIPSLAAWRSGVRCGA